MSGLAKAGKFCLNCYFFELGAVPVATSEVRIDSSSDVGTCQRMPPALNLDGECVWPRVNRVRSCGEWVCDRDNWWDGHDDPPGGGDEVPVPFIGLAASDGRLVQ